MVRIVQSVLSFFFFIFSLFGNVAYGTQTFTLADVFCGEMAQRLVPNASLSNEAWNEIKQQLENHPESSFSSAQLTPAQTQTLQRCLSVFEDAFFRAEVLLEGRAIVAGQLSRRGLPESPSDRGLESVSADLGFAAVTVRVAPARAENSFSGSVELRRRRDWYQSQWDQYFDDVKKRANQTLINAPTFPS